MKLLTFLLLIVGSGAVPNEKVEICHIPPGNPENFNTIYVKNNEVDDHLSHGDFLGACENNCDKVCPTDNKCLNSVCNENGCLPPLVVDCESGDLCILDSCDNEIGCIHTPKDCSDGNLCTLDSCDSNTGECLHFPALCFALPCETSYCSQDTGLCVRETINCDDGNSCTEDSCDTTTNQCVHTNICLYNCLCSVAADVDVCDAPYVQGYFIVTFLGTLDNVRVSPAKCSTCSNLGCVDTPYTTTDYQNCITAYGC